jgi:hypothetical protein
MTKLDLRETGELSIAIPSLKRPALEELQKMYFRAGSIERDLSTEAPVVLRLTTVLDVNEVRIDGEEYEKRLSSSTSHPLLGYQQAQWLVAHQGDYPVLMALLGQIRIDCPGIVMLGLDGPDDRFFPSVHTLGFRWSTNRHWWKEGFSRSDRVAIG